MATVKHTRERSELSQVKVFVRLGDTSDRSTHVNGPSVHHCMVIPSVPDE
jgi:hypothetical protein